MTHGGSLTQMWATANLETCLPFLGQGGKGKVFGPGGPRSEWKPTGKALCGTAL